MKCTECNCKTNYLRTEQFKNINGKLVQLIPNNEAWCKSCINSKGLKSLTEINLMNAKNNLPSSLQK